MCGCGSKDYSKRSSSKKKGTCLQAARETAPIGTAIRTPPTSHRFTIPWPASAPRHRCWTDGSEEHGTIEIDLAGVALHPLGSINIRHYAVIAAAHHFPMADAAGKRLTDGPTAPPTACLFQLISFLTGSNTHKIATGQYRTAHFPRFCRNYNRNNTPKPLLPTRVSSSSPKQQGRRIDSLKLPRQGARWRCKKGTFTPNKPIHVRARRNPRFPDRRVF